MRKQRGATAAAELVDSGNAAWSRRADKDADGGTLQTDSTRAFHCWSQRPGDRRRAGPLAQDGRQASQRLNGLPQTWRDGSSGSGDDSDGRVGNRGASSVQANARVRRISGGEYWSKTAHIRDHDPLVMLTLAPSCMSITIRGSLSMIPNRFSTLERVAH